jgi:hypothetical protein
VQTEHSQRAGYAGMMRDAEFSTLPDAALVHRGLAYRRARPGAESVGRCTPLPGPRALDQEPSRSGGGGAGAQLR